jgi:hypothetical protein
MLSARLASLSSRSALRYSRNASGDGSSNANLSASSRSCCRFRTSACRRSTSCPCASSTRRAPASSIAVSTSPSERSDFRGRYAGRRCCRRGIRSGSMPHHPSCPWATLYRARTSGTSTRCQARCPAAPGTNLRQTPASPGVWNERLAHVRGQFSIGYQALQILAEWQLLRCARGGVVEQDPVLEPLVDEARIGRIGFG